MLLLDVVKSEVVRVIDAGQMHLLIAANDSFTLIEQHPYAHSFQAWNHLDGIVVAKHPINGLL